MSARLVYQRDGRGHEHELRAPGLVIGREAPADLPLGIDGVSKRHCRLFVQDGAWHIEDLKSLNGTLVNDDMVLGPRALRDGDRIKLGAARSALFEAQFRLGPPRVMADAARTVVAPPRVTPDAAKTIVPPPREHAGTVIGPPPRMPPPPPPPEASRQGREALVAELARVRGELTRQQQEAEEAEQRRRGAEAARAVTAQALDELRIQHTDVRHALVNARERVTALEKQLEVAQRERTQHRAVVDQLERRCEKAEKEAAGARDELVKQRQRAAARSADLAHLVRQGTSEDDLRRLLEEREREIDRLRARLAGLGIEDA
jgi:hypothetical protein